MRFQNVLVVCASVFFPLLTGCALFDGAPEPKENNVAHFIPNDVSSHGSSARKKPAQPRPIEDEYVCGQREDSICESSCVRKEQARESQKLSIYVVQRGDSIYGIARKYGVSPSELMDLNGLSGDSKLIVGQKLKVDVEWQLKPEEKRSPVAPPETIYVVRYGDSLSKIAMTYGISWKALKKANDLQSDRLKVGQKLKIPARPSSESGAGAKEQSVRKMERDGDEKYTVKKGDNLSLIAKHFGVSQADLQSANAIVDPQKLRIGQKLIIPQPAFASKNASVPAVLPIATQGRRPFSASDEMYEIKSGDSVSQIAKNLNVSEKDLMELNNLSKVSVLQVGKKLLVPQKKISSEGRSRENEKQPENANFFESFEEIPVIEINN
ncbi:MAG: LysM peptidoglycan-binding domain-containing protein [Puniceicoccales bacterium]|jgi:LysM repeat protein|nr:LysM peptidoglycan-binding domain-containing protein [Puniceicoccales bacterium]